MPEPRRKRVRDCSHERRGELTIHGAGHEASFIGRNSHGDHLGAIVLEFCDECGVVFVAPQYVATVVRPRSKRGA